MSPSSIDSASTPDNIKFTNLLILLIFSPYLRYSCSVQNSGVHAGLLTCIQQACIQKHTRRRSSTDVHVCTHTRTQREFNGLAIIWTRKFIQVWRRPPLFRYAGHSFQRLSFMPSQFRHREQRKAAARFSKLNKGGNSKVFTFPRTEAHDKDSRTEELVLD